MKTPYELRFGEKFKDIRISFELRIFYFSTSAHEVEDRHKDGWSKDAWQATSSPARIWYAEHLVFNAKAFVAARLGHYVKEHTTEDIYAILLTTPKSFHSS